jgi:regulator of sirC expression with transglutaminase-like and TPR domain
MSAEGPSSTGNSQTIWDLPSIPEQDIDIGYWALVIAKECDSTIDMVRYLHALDSMAARIRYMVGPREGDMVRFVMTQMYQFEPGEWNEGQICSYDLDDPLGEKPGARLLTTYLDTHKGNCVSMPTLFLALIERVDPTIPFNGVAAPLHLFCRFYDRQDDTVWNVEATSGGYSVREEWAIEQFGISRAAIDSGIYMRSLSKKEYIAELISVLVAKHRVAKEYDKALKLAELILELNPRSITGIVHKAALLGWLGHIMQERIIKIEQRRPTEEEAEKLKLYKIQSDSLIERAKSLGWEPPTAESRERYLQTITEAKTMNSE